MITYKSTKKTAQFSWEERSQVFGLPFNNRLKAVVSGPVHESLALPSTIVKNFSCRTPNFRTRLTSIKALVVVFFLSFFSRPKMVKLALSEGVNGRLPDLDLDEGQLEFPGTTIDEYKSASCCLFPVLFGDQKW